MLPYKFGYLVVTQVFMARPAIPPSRHRKPRTTLAPFPVPLHPELARKLSKLYEPKTTVGDVFKGYDITFATNEHGEPVLLFFGKRRPDGLIVSERYTRPIKREPGSLAVKSSHWDNQGKIRA
ncbi:MAG: hypothetical protein ACRYFX_00635 [Janthinobacterium lividum]